MKPRIHLVVERADGRRSEAEVDGAQVTSDMLDSAEDLLHTITTGERPIAKNFYELCAKAFGTTREDAKRRVLAAAYSKTGTREPRELRSAIKQEDWSWPPLHNIPAKKKP